jgi:hypothetical protein
MVRFENFTSKYWQTPSQECAKLQDTFKKYQQLVSTLGDVRIRKQAKQRNKDSERILS